MGTGPGGEHVLKVDPEQLQKYGGQLLSAAGDLPDAPAPFTVTGTDAISQAIAGKLPGLEGPIQDGLPQLKNEASSTASKVVTAAGQYASTDAQIAADYERHQFDSAGSPGGGSAGSGGGSNSVSQMDQMTSMPMQMASQAAQLPMQAMGAVGQVPQGIMQGVQQIGQMTGGLGGSESGSGRPDARGDDDRPEERAKHEAPPGATAGAAHAERAPLTPAAPQQSAPRHAAPDPSIDL
ncbi:MAG: hypothetical protein QOJ95_4448 [Mycobacterium sp.]|jgi:hypothetical protein|nr:hypothetical protein [Mycobacterium sp.]